MAIARALEEIILLQVDPSARFSQARPFPQIRGYVSSDDSRRTCVAQMQFDHLLERWTAFDFLLPNISFLVLLMPGRVNLEFQPSCLLHADPDCALEVESVIRCAT